MLAETPSITNYSDAGNSQGYSYYRIRGIDQTRVNMTLDGVPMNEPEDQGAYFSNYPDLLNSISKMQIQRGIGTTQNGVASYGGSIQLYSPTLQDSTYTAIGLGYGSFNSTRAFAAFNSGIKNNKAIYARLSHVSSDGYKYNSANNSQSAFISSGIYGDKSSWKINLLLGKQRNQLAWLGVADSLIKIDRKINANKNENDQFIQSLAQVQNSYQFNSNSSLQSSLYFTLLKGNYDFNFNNFIGLPSTDELYNYAFNSKLIGAFCNYNWTYKNINWTSGFHANKYNRQHVGSEKKLGELYKNTGYKNELSAFSKMDYSIKQLSFFIDLQYRYVNFDYKGSVAFDKIDWQFFNPKSGLSFALNAHNSIYYSIGKTSREPTRNDLFGGNDNLVEDGFGNAAIYIKTPESVINQELGYRYTFREANFSTNFYYMSFENEIVLNGKFGPNGLPLTNNVEKSYRAGIEVSANYSIAHKLIMSTNASFNHSRIREKNIVFSPILTPAVIISQEISYPYRGFGIALIGRYQDGSYIDFENSSSINSYFIINARLSYNFKRFEFCTYLNNITNVNYFNNGYVDYDGSKKYFVQAPINYYLSLKYNF